METLIIAIIGSVLGSTGLFTLIQALINRHDKKKGRLAEIQNRIEKTERDIREVNLGMHRMQLLLLMYDYAEGADTKEIMTVAEKYFVTLEGDWYMTGVFGNFVERKGIAKPGWLNKKED